MLAARPAIIPQELLREVTVAVVHGVAGGHVHGHGRQVHVLHALLALLRLMRHPAIRGTKALLGRQFRWVPVATHLHLMHMPWLRQRGHAHGLRMKPLHDRVLAGQVSRVLRALLQKWGTLGGVLNQGEVLGLRGPRDHVPWHGGHLQGHPHLPRLWAVKVKPGVLRSHTSACRALM